MISRLAKQLAVVVVTSATVLSVGSPAASAQSVAGGLPGVPTLPGLPAIPALPSVDTVLAQARGLVPPELLGAVGSAGPVGATTTTGGYADVGGGLRTAVTQQVNAWRGANGRAALAPNPWLESEAQAWAENLAARNVVEHNGDLLKRSGGGENIVAAATSCNAACLVDLWKNSPGHNASMLDPQFRSAGMGIAYSRDGKVFVVQDFAY